MDDTCCFHVIRLGPKKSVYHMKVIVVSTAAGCDVTNFATTLQGFNKHSLSGKNIRDYFLKSKEISCSQRQDLKH